MEQEFSAQDYSTSNFDFGTMMDQPGEFALDVVMEEDAKSVKKDSRGFIIAGLLSVLAGAGIIIAANVDLTLQNLLPYFIGGGIAALGYGMIKAFRKVFSRKKLNLPSLTLKRKVQKQSTSTFQQTRNQPNFTASTAANAARTSFQSAKSAAKAAASTVMEAQKGKKLGKSYQNKVFMGVASGLAEYAGVNPGLIRLVFIFSFFFSAGLVALLYGFLGIVLPQKSPNTTR